jgi:biopolymer transport protein ExbB/TolQ
MLVVSDQANQKPSWSALRGLGWPVLIGAALTSGFYVLLARGPFHLPFIERYFASHPVAYIETTMFFIGMCALLFKFVEVWGQQSSLNSVHLDEMAETPEGKSDCKELLAGLKRLPTRVRESYLGKRIQDALSLVRRKGGAQGLDDELKYLADTDAMRQHDGYSLVRMIIWATPMLGFLGTVVGITQALGDLDSQQLASDIQGAMDGLLAGLYVAFDTTALALTLSIIMMFVMFLVNRLETQLLAVVDRVTSQQLVGRFESFDSSSDPQVAAIQRMSHAVIQASEQLVKRQAQLWQTSMDNAQQQWTQLVQHSSQHIQDNVAESLRATLDDHANQLTDSTASLVEITNSSWTHWRDSLQENAQLLHDQQAEMVQQTQLLTQVLGATDTIGNLEQSLNNNLQALAGSKNFEDTVMSLSAAIHLLTTRLEQPAQSASFATTETTPRDQGRAA